MAKTTTTSNSTAYGTQSAVTDPRYTQTAYDQYAAAQAAAAGMTPAQMAALPGLTPDQIAAQERARLLASGGSTLGGVTDAISPFLNYQPSRVSAPTVTAGSIGGGAGASAGLVNRGAIQNVTADQITAPQFSAADLERVRAAFDPTYTNDVINASQADLNRLNQMALIENNSLQARQGAFGGSRGELQNAETNRAYADVGARTAADLRLAGFNKVLETLQQDYGRQFDASKSNQGANLTASGLNQGADLTAETTNANNRTQASAVNAQTGTQAAIAQLNAALAASQANASNAIQAGALNQGAGLDAARLGLTAGGLLLDVNNTERNRALQDIELLDSVGQQNYNQQVAQNAIDYQNAENRNQNVLTQQDIVQRALGFLPQDQTVTTTGTTKSTDESRTKQGFWDVFGNILGGGLQAAGSIYAGKG